MAKDKQPPNPLKSLNEDQVKKLGEDATKIFYAARQQLDEYKVIMKAAVQDAKYVDGVRLSEERVTALLNSIDQTRVIYSQKEGKDLSVVWDFDELCLEFFRNPEPNLLVNKGVVDDFKTFSVLPEKQDKIRKATKTVRN